MAQLMERAKAERLGLKRFFTAVPCRNGHVDERYVNGGTCASCIKETQRKQRKIHYEHLLEKNRKYCRNNPDWARAKRRKYKNANLDKIRVYRRNRKAIYKNSKGKHTAADILDILRMQKSKCACCKTSLKKNPYHVDHIIPLSKGGGNDRRNLQILCAPCNQSKSALDPLVFMRSKGKLL